MHAVSRLAFGGLIDNIQASWVKMGREGALECLKAGANDLGGSLMNESITRAAGSKHGQEWCPRDIDRAIRNLGRIPCNRTTLYQEASFERIQSSKNSSVLLPVENLVANKRAVDKKLNVTNLVNDRSFKSISNQVFLMAASN
jgi:FO synthase